MAEKEEAQQQEAKPARRLPDLLHNVLVVAIATLVVGIVIGTTVKLHSQDEDGIEYDFDKLSGGEQSLISLCIMLSLNFLSPSSFSIYDDCFLLMRRDLVETFVEIIKNNSSLKHQYCFIMTNLPKPFHKIPDINIINLINDSSGCHKVE